MDNNNPKKNDLSIITQIYTEDNSNEIQVKVTYEDFTKISYNLAIRMKIIDLLEEKFIQPVIDKGIQKEHQKILLQNNRSEFKQFMERKLRYWLNELIHEEDFVSVLNGYNQLLFSEIQNNAKMIPVTAYNSKRKLMIKTINDHILLSNKTILPKKIAKLILRKNDYKEKILGFFNEFLKYLIVF